MTHIHINTITDIQATVIQKPPAAKRDQHASTKKSPQKTHYSQSQGTLTLFLCFNTHTCVLTQYKISQNKHRYSNKQTKKTH